MNYKVFYLAIGMFLAVLGFIYQEYKHEKECQEQANVGIWGYGCEIMIAEGVRVD